jgi:hypothetical protein
MRFDDTILKNMRVVMSIDCFQIRTPNLAITEEFGREAQDRGYKPFVEELGAISIRARDDVGLKEIDSLVDAFMPKTPLEVVMRDADGQEVERETYRQRDPSLEARTPF